MARRLKEAFLSIAFWQIILTPYLLLWVHLDWAAYGRWCFANMLLSAILGPLFVAVVEWMENDGDD